MDSDDDMHDANYSDSLDNDYYSGDNGIGSDGDGGFEFDNSDDSDDSISRHRQQSLLRLFGRQSLLRLFGRQRRTSVSAASTATVQHYNSLSPAPTRPSTAAATPAAETVRLQPFSASFGLAVQSISSRTIQPVSAPNSKASSFEFIYPASWVGDQTLLRRAVGKAELERTLDLPPLSDKKSTNRRLGSSSNEPKVAFGPPGSNGELNVSVIVSAVPLDFSIEAFGGSKEIGETVVRTITGSRSGVKATLIESTVREDSTKQLNYYKLEF